MHVFKMNLKKCFVISKTINVDFVFGMMAWQIYITEAAEGLKSSVQAVELGA